MALPWEKLISVGNNNWSRVRGVPRKQSKLDRVVELIRQNKSSAVVRELSYIKRVCKLVKELTLEYPLDKDELFLQTTIEPGRYLIHVVTKRGSSILHRFFIRESSIKRVKGHSYSVISMRIPSALRGSKLYIKVYKLPGDDAAH